MASRRRRRRWIVPSLVAMGLAASVAVMTRPPAEAADPPAAAAPAPAGRAGVVTTADGQPYAGNIAEDDRYVTITTAGATVRLDRRNVSRIDYAADVQAEYDKRHAKLAAGDVKGRSALATWATEHKRLDLALAALDEARQLDPTNRDVALATQSVERQLDLDRKAGKTGGGTARGRTASAATQSAPTTTAVAIATMAPHRLLNAAEINRIRQKELRPDDPMVKVRLENNVGRKYMLGAYGDTTGMLAKKFMAMTGEEQALEVLNGGTPAMAKDVRILTDPMPLHLFKDKVMPIVAQGCASVACHGGGKAGSFVLYEGNTTPAVYTNFYILMTYTAEINGVQYVPVDREVPTRSLALQFGLPELKGRPPHPAVAGWHPRFKGFDDPAYVTVSSWVTNDLRFPQPEYDINVSPRLSPGQKPATLPTAEGTAGTAATATPVPSSRPAGATTRPEPAHGTPLPHVYPGGPTTLPGAP